MGDDITVSSGTLIAVDTELLRAAAVSIDDIAQLIDGAEACFSDALALQQYSICSDAVSSGWAITADTPDLRTRGASVATALRRAADTYEAIELELQRSRAETPDPAVQARLAELYRSRLGLRLEVMWALASWRYFAGTEPLRQILLTPEGARFPGPVVEAWALQAALTAQVAVRILDRGNVANGTRLSGPLPSVEVATVGEPAQVAAPSDFVDTTERVPTSGDVRVVVEKYTAPDGEPIAFVYVSGTRPDGGEGEAMSWGSNLLPYLYTWNSTASAAVEGALAAAGVASGSRIAVVGYSQGALVTEMMAAGGDYHVAYAQSMGSPVEAEVDADTTHVQFLHDDDPIRIVRDAAFGATAGTAESVLVERAAAPGLQLSDVTTPHQIDEYLETARQADASDDPRLIAALADLRALTDGTPGVRYEFSATALFPGRDEDEE